MGDRQKLKFIRKFVYDITPVTLSWGARVYVWPDEDGGIGWFTSNGVTLDDIYRHFRQEVAFGRLPTPTPQPAGWGESGGIEPECVSKQGAANLLGVDVRTIEHLVRTRKLEYVQIGSQRGRVIPVASVRKFIADNKQLTAAEELRKRRRR